MSFLNTRRGMTLVAWGLLLVSMGWPTPWGTSEGTTASTGMYVLGNLIRPESYGASAFAILPRSGLVLLAFLTNVLFLFSVWFRDKDDLSRAFQGVLVGALAIDIAVPFALRDFAHMPGCWLWLTAVSCIVWAFLARPANGQASPGYVTAQWRALVASDKNRSGLPDIVWAWLGWLAFWSVITVLSHWVKPEVAADATSQVVKVTALTAYVNDFADALRPETVERLGASLAQFEKETSNQVAVAIYSRLPDATIEEFTLEVAEKSRLGRKGLDNGAILFVFPAQKVARIEVGYGLEGSLTDVGVRRILDSVLVPALNAGDAGKGVEGALQAVMSAVRDDYKAGRMPGRLAVFWRQLTVEVPRFVKGVFPTLVATPLDARFGISFFGTFFLFGFWDGFVQTRAILRNAIIAAGNLPAGRPFTAGTQPVRIESIWDSLKILLFVGFSAYVVAGIVVIAGGGAYGNAGATLRW